MSDLPLASDVFVQNEVEATALVVRTFEEKAADDPALLKLVEHARYIHSMTLELQRYRLLFAKLEDYLDATEIKPVLILGFDVRHGEFAAADMEGKNFRGDELLKALEKAVGIEPDLQP